MKSSNEFLSQVRREGSKRSEEHTSELQSQSNLVCRLLLEKKKKQPPHQPFREASHITPSRQGATFHWCDGLYPSRLVRGYVRRRISWLSTALLQHTHGTCT